MLRKLKNQNGFTLIGFIFVLILGLMVALVAMKMIPKYIEYGSVVKSLKTEASKPGSSTMSIRDVRKNIGLVFSVNYVESIKPQDVKMSRKGGKKIFVKYEVREHLVGNVDIVMSFEHSELMNR
ncbi:MAG: DUF4845 domain-containing protein [bacterium]